MVTRPAGGNVDDAANDLGKALQPAGSSVNRLPSAGAALFDRKRPDAMTVVYCGGSGEKTVLSEVFGDREKGVLRGEGLIELMLKDPR